MKNTNEALAAQLTQVLLDNESWQLEVLDSHNGEVGGGFNENYSLSSLTTMVEPEGVFVLIDFSNEYRSCSEEESGSEERYPGGDQVKLSLGSVEDVTERLNKKAPIEMSYSGSVWGTLAVEGVSHE